MKKVMLLIGIMFFVNTHSFADMLDDHSFEKDIAHDLKARQSQFVEELGGLREQEIKIVKDINDSIDRYSKDQDLKTLRQVIDGKTKLIHILQKEEDVCQGYIGDLEKNLSETTNRKFAPLGKKVTED